MSRPLTVLIAPDSFKGSLKSVQVAHALADGWARARADDTVLLCPLADGGEGTLEAVAAAGGWTWQEMEVADPLGRPIRARWLRSEDGRRAVVEMAEASGLSRLAADERDAVAASSAGTGELIRAALDAGVDSIVLGIGGSATTDGGAGAIAAIEEAGGLRGARLVVLCDVRTPFERAAEVFAPQKGADTATVKRLARRLRDQAQRLPKDPRGEPMTGAAGGLAGGLWAAFDAKLVPGAAFVLDALGFDARARASRAVVTGEGRLDRQSLSGKAVGEVATRCRQRGIPCHAVVGSDGLPPFEHRLLDLASVDEATTLVEIEAAARALGERL